jgi:hypothetical protein
MLRELKLQVLHSSAHTFQYLDRNSKFTIARGADCNGRGGSKPLKHAEIAFRMGSFTRKLQLPISCRRMCEKYHTAAVFHGEN